MVLPEHTPKPDPEPLRLYRNIYPKRGLGFRVYTSAPFTTYQSHYPTARSPSRCRTLVVEAPPNESPPTLNPEPAIPDLEPKIALTP